MWSRLFKNPFTVWLSRTIKAMALEHKYRKRHLSIGYMSVVIDSDFGKYNTIYDNVTLKNVTLGDMTYISSATMISNARIGSFCSIAPNCKIGVGLHPSRAYVSSHPAFYSTLRQSQISFAKETGFTEYKMIEIGNDVWIGIGAVIMDGVKIGDGAIIGAGAVVTKDVMPYMIVGGVPASVIRQRFDEKTIQFLQQSRWWDLDLGFLEKNYLAFSDIESLQKLLNK